MGRSFAGTAKTDPEGTVDWMLGPQLHGKWDDPRRSLFVQWGIQFVWTMAVERSGGFVLGARKPDGDLGAAIIVVPYLDGMPWRPCATVRDLKSLRTVGFPPVKQMGEARKGIEARLKCLDIVQEMHQKHCPGPHVYVNVMAVDPSAQGMGFCSKLMRAANSYADSFQMPIYLETSGHKNVAIYKRYGYEVAEQYELNSPNDPDGAVPHDDEFAMVRPAFTENSDKERSTV